MSKLFLEVSNQERIIKSNQIRYRGNILILNDLNMIDRRISYIGKNHKKDSKYGMQAMVWLKNEIE